MTTVADVMTRGVQALSPSDTVTAAARAMDELNVGVIPVCEGGKLLGMVTDRDIVVRGMAQGLDGNSTRLVDVMSTSLRTAVEQDDVEDVLQLMSENQIRRLPVVDAGQRLIGMVTLGDIAAKALGGDADVGLSLAAISSPAEPDRSSFSASTLSDSAA